MLGNTASSNAGCVFQKERNVFGGLLDIHGAWLIQTVATD